MENARAKRILILGGGFAGLTVAMELERKLARDPSAEIRLSAWGRSRTPMGFPECKNMR